jgi:hypothetical protein
LSQSPPEIVRAENVTGTLTFVVRAWLLAGPGLPASITKRSESGVTLSGSGAGTEITVR